MKKPKHILLKFLRISFKAHKAYFFVLLFQIIITSLMTLFGAYTLSLLIGQLEKGIYINAIYMGLALVGVEVILGLLNQFAQRLLDVHQSKMSEAIDLVVSKKIMELPFQYLEDPYYLELKKNAEMGVNNMGALYSLMSCGTRILSSIISIIGLISIIITFDWMLVIILVVGILFNVFIVYIMMKSHMKFYKELLPINFKYGYYLNTLMSTTQCKDFRLYSIGGLLEKNLNSFSIQIAKNFRKSNLKMKMYDSLMSTLRYVQMAIIYSMVGIKTLVKHLPISSFTLTISSAINFSDCVTAIIESSAGYIRSIEYITPLVELMEIPTEEEDGKEVLESLETICFDHVFFKYPKTENYVLEDVSFEIKKGEKISVVGLNGAGKTTIVKLICRLYSVTQGEIRINGIPIQNYQKDQYIKAISAVFQDYKLFAYSIRENIHPQIDEESLEAICEEVGIKESIEGLPNKYESVLSRNYEDGGIDMSGGQKQKIAIARALAKQADLLILDEPTSALDPLAEAEIYENFNKMVLHKTAIYISHRMSSSIFCDKVLVLENGKVSHFDSHNNLMKEKDSLYYKLFTSQAKNYKLT
ncbi:MAG: ABC transporter ATP-binding protein/permease [Anaeroplasmataceae bacterium]|nr:ABC transporter ATP-binding protein/permease [Anaeroplasmataceae bacterium]MDE6414115.1 ABC transporter ATP-binding protein/permease [Anaeroplasmataceae bacterium]